jgi:hypothetical protein
MRMPPTCLIRVLLLFLTCSTIHAASHDQRKRSSGRGLRWGLSTRDLWQLPSARSQTRRNGRRRRRRALKKDEDDWHGNDDRNFAWSTPSPTTVPFFVLQPPPPPTPVMVASTPAPQPQPVPEPPVDNGTPDNTPNDNGGNENGMDTGSSESTTTTYSADREQVCRAAARGKPLTTDVVVDVAYTMDVQLAASASSSQAAATISPIYAGMTVNAAVTDFLTRVYIDRYCFDSNSNNRHLQGNGNSGTAPVTTQLDGTKIVVWGVTGGTTQRSTQPCETVASATEDTVPTCFRLETSNRIFLGSNSSVASIKDIAMFILQDINLAFYNGAVMKGVQDSGDAQAAVAIVQTTYVSGSYVGDESANGASTNKSSSGRDGLKPAGKAFLTLFLLCLIGVACFAGYKYGYPKFREHQWRRKHNASSMATTPTTTTSRGGSDGMKTTPWSLPSMESIRERVLPSMESIRERVLPSRGGGASDTTPVHSSDEESSVRSLYNETALLAETDGSSSRQKRSDEPNIVLTEATGSPSNSPNEFGTEMILDDLRLQQPDFTECGSTIEFTNTTSSFRFSPTKLNKIEERRRKDETMVSVEGGDYNFSQDAFSFSDINIIVDDSSSVGAASSAPYYLQAAKRSYNVPDTVNL